MIVFNGRPWIGAVSKNINVSILNHKRSAILINAGQKILKEQRLFERKMRSKTTFEV